MSAPRPCADRRSGTVLIPSAWQALALQVLSEEWASDAARELARLVFAAAEDTQTKSPGGSDE